MQLHEGNPVPQVRPTEICQHVVRHQPLPMELEGHRLQALRHGAPLLGFLGGGARGFLLWEARRVHLVLVKEHLGYGVGAPERFAAEVDLDGRSRGAPQAYAEVQGDPLFVFVTRQGADEVVIHDEEDGMRPAVKADPDDVPCPSETSANQYQYSW